MRHDNGTGEVLPEGAALTFRRSESIGAFAAALAKAQSAMGAAKKDSTNPHFKSSYADLASVMDACRPHLNANGIAVTQIPSSGNDSVTISTMLVHASGEWMAGELTLPVLQRTAQAFGSAMTYARRYALSAMAGVAAGEDDDGTAASQKKYTPPDEPPKGGAPKPNTKTEGIKAQLKAKIEAKPGPKIIDVAPGETETQAEQRASWDPKTTVGFGSYKGTPILSMTVEALDMALTIGREQLEKSPKASWAASLQENLDAIADALDLKLSEGAAPQAKTSNEADVPF